MQDKLWQRVELPSRIFRFTVTTCEHCNPHEHCGIPIANMV
jgi:hypothetical protein